MNLLDFIFKLGVVFSIYEFIWGIFDLGTRMIIYRRQRSILEIYIFRAIKYFFLVDVTFLFCLESITSDMVVLNQVILAGIILLIYFIGKLQKNQNKSMFFQFTGQGLPQKENNFNLKSEIVIIILSLTAFSLFWFYPSYASNPISFWFHKSIINIEHTPIFGFIFKIIGLFFLFNLIFKMLKAITFVLNGGKFVPANNYRNQNDDNHFDDYTEIS